VPAAAARATSTTQIDEPGFSRSHASPSVRRFARELGADLARIEGSGAKGRITADDVKAYVKRLLTAPPQVGARKLAEGSCRRLRGVRARRAQTAEPHPEDFRATPAGKLDHHPARHAVRRSRHHRDGGCANRLKQETAEKGIKLTPLAFVMRACVKALAEFPSSARSLDRAAGELVMKALRARRVCGRIRRAGWSFRSCATRIARMCSSSRASWPTQRESAQRQAGGWRTCRVGALRSRAWVGSAARLFTPIINAPEVAILGVSRATQRPVFQDGAFVPRLMLPLSLSYDHRVIDGGGPPPVSRRSSRRHSGMPQVCCRPYRERAAHVRAGERMSSPGAGRHAGGDSSRPG
jgi:pyruvate dehydrogenase E2 component (dihydrolipoamide acetyltransferase)